MTAISTILLGTVALTNVALVAYLLGDRNKVIKSRNDKNRQPEDVMTSENAVPKSDEQESPSRVGESKFNIDEFLQKFEKLEQGVKKMNMTLDKIEGEVRFRDVEFAVDENNTSNEKIAIENVNEKGFESNSVESRNEIQIPDDKLEETFQDARIEDFDGDKVSSPSASGSSIEDIEESVNVASNPDAQVEDKIKAAKILCPLLDTNLMAAAEDKIKNDILACVREFIRSEVADKSNAASKSQQRTSSVVKQKPVKIEKSKREFYVSKNLSDFNPEDLIPK